MHAPTSQRSALTYARGSWYADESIKAELLTIVNTNFGSGKLVLIGGVQINMPPPYEDHFMPLIFDACSATSNPVDMLPTLLL